MKEIRLSEWIGEGFYDIHRDIREGRHTHYWLKGGRGSGNPHSFHWKFYWG